MSIGASAKIVANARDGLTWMDSQAMATGFSPNSQAERSICSHIPASSGRGDQSAG